MGRIVAVEYEDMDHLTEWAGMSKVELINGMRSTVAVKDR